MPDALVLDMALELRLEFMAIVGANLANAEREPGDDGIDEVDHVCLVVSVVVQGTDARGIVDCGVLVTLDGFPVLPSNFKNLTSTWIWWPGTRFS